MHCPESFFALLTSKQVEFFTGVPDSLLKELLLVISQRVSGQQHVICANEGAAVALAAGYNLGSGKIAAVYMQNSGLGNAINPLLSLTHSRVYSIPLLLLIGWRGEPGQLDEPQHIASGQALLGLLQQLNIPCSIVGSETSNLEEVVASAVQECQSQLQPYALIFKSGTFSKARYQYPATKMFVLSRREAIRIVLNALSAQDLVVSSTGYTSRELYDERIALKENSDIDFLNIGAMGHTSQIALGLAMARPERKVVCLDGDGAAIMHMGSLTTIGSTAPTNLIHIILNNGAHDSVGGQPTAGLFIDFSMIARACGYKMAHLCSTADELRSTMANVLQTAGPSAIEVRINTGSSDKLSRPGNLLLTRKTALMRHLGLAKPEYEQIPNDTN